MRVVLFLFGLVLLLPGACSLTYMALILPNEFKSTYNDPYLSLAEMLWAFCFLVSFGGVLLIRYAWRISRDDGPRIGGRTGDPPAKRD
jgi:hypothetical protein